MTKIVAAMANSIVTKIGNRSIAHRIFEFDLPQQYKGRNKGKGVNSPTRSRFPVHCDESRYEGLITSVYCVSFSQVFLCLGEGNHVLRLVPRDMLIGSVPSSR